MAAGEREDNRNCVREFNTYQWQPGKVTTFILPVVDIEMLITKLTNMLPDLVGKDKVNIQKQIGNWQKVLSTYRGHNDDLTQIFSADNQFFLSMLRSFQKFKAGGITESDFLNSVESFIGYDPEALGLGLGLFHASYDNFDNLCSVGVGRGNTLVQSVCSDFSSSKSDYKDLYGFLRTACDLPGSLDSGGSSNPLRNSVLINKMCATGSVASAADIPGGLGNADTSGELMGFLKSNTKYITFSSNTGTSLSWTSSVSDSLTVSASEDLSRAFNSGGELHSGIDVAGGAVNFGTSLGLGGGHSLSIGKSSDSSHDFSRTVSIFLDDNDLGKIKNDRI